LAKVVRVGLVSAKQVEALELLAKKFASQGAASFSQIGRDNTPKGQGPLSRLDDATYDSMSAQERFRLSRLSS
jgi:hypothetical protein